MPLPPPRARRPVLPARPAGHHRARRFHRGRRGGKRGGLELLGYTAQALFLLGCGLLDALAALGEPGTPAVLRETAAVQKLLSPAEMGELFKVLALARTPGIAWPGFALADRAHRL